LRARLQRGFRSAPELRPTMRELLAELEEERSQHQLARAERLLEEARPLARATGGEAGFARVASRLLRDLVSETPRALAEIPPAASLAEVELSGAHAQALLNKLGSPALASHFMLREGIGALQDDGTIRFDVAGWYPIT